MSGNDERRPGVDGTLPGMTTRHMVTRRGALALVGVSTIALAGCASGVDPYPRGIAPAPISPLPATGDVLGTGSVRVALLLPRTAQGNAAGLAASMRNAAELALADFRGNDLTVLVKDTRGTPEGAVEAVNAALAEQVELVIGPLFAAEVRAAGPIARNAGIPVLSFSSDPTVAAPGIWVMGFLVGDQVRQVVAQAAASGKRSMAALVPESAYGTLAEAALREAAARNGVRLVQVERYAAGDVTAKAQLVAASASQIDSVFAPEGPGVAPQVAAVLGSAGVDPSRVRILGSGQWNEPGVYGNGALAGSWFPAPDIAAFQQFAARYRGAYGADPQQTATLAYDAVVLAAGLVRAAGARRFEASVIANPEGFLSSVNGLFRFTPNGTNDRGYAIYEVTGATPSLVQAAPRSFAGF
jgi:ABC-type branched-subunit amino acid transport system substrate-binding protein